jgi:hypothetical protein
MTFLVEFGFGASILPSVCTVEMEGSNGVKMKIRYKEQIILKTMGLRICLHAV